MRNIVTEDVIKDYEIWLSKKHKSNTCASRISRIKRISVAYDILKEYSIDECDTLLDSLSYSAADKKEGLESKTDIIIEGDYVTGLASLKQALAEFVSYLKEKNYCKPLSKSSTATFLGSFDDFKRFVGPKCRNEVNLFCKQERDAHNGICEYCRQKAILQSAHLKDRPIIIYELLEKHYKKSTDYYEVDLYDFLEKFKKAHMPIRNNIFFLCKDCHNKLDKAKSITPQDVFNKRKNTP